MRRQWRKLRAVPGPQLLSYLADRMAHRPDAFTAALPPALRSVRAAMWAAMNSYRPRLYDAGPIVYVRATTRQDDRGEPMPLWRRVAHGGLVIAEVSNYHENYRHRLTLHRSKEPQ